MPIQSLVLGEEVWHVVCNPILSILKVFSRLEGFVKATPTLANHVFMNFAFLQTGIIILGQVWTLPCGSTAGTL